MRRTVLGADGLEQEENGARVELKNLSSLRTIQHAIGMFVGDVFKMLFDDDRVRCVMLHASEYEIQRQTHHLLTATTPLPAETRGYDPLTSTTIHLRPKETTLDYRYMPDPDLPPIVVDPAEVEALRKAMPELPDARRRRLERVYGVSAYQAERLVETPGAAALFERAVWTPTLKSGTGEIVTSSSSTATSQHPRDAVHVANTLLNTVFGEMTALGMLTLTRDGADVSMSNATVTARTSEDHHLLTDGDEDSNLILSPRQLASVVDAVDAGRIAYHQGKTILGKMLQANVANDRTTNNVERDALVDRFLEGVTFVDGETLRAAVRDLARANPLQVAQLGGIIPLTSTGTPLQPPPSPPPPRKVKPTVLTWFSGQLMRTVRGRADPAQMHAALEQVLGKEFSVAPSVFQSWHAASDGGGSGKRKDKKNKKKGGE